MRDLFATEPDTQLYTAAESRLLDQCAIQEHNIPGYELMKRAGAAAFSEIRQSFPDCKRWAILCGGGNNGGDGYVVGYEALRHGIECAVFALKPPGDLNGDAAQAADDFRKQGGQARLNIPESFRDFDLVVDALLGTGLDRAPQGQYARAISRVNESGSFVVAVDIPSGLSADSGVALGGIAVRADLTITFIGRKRGLYTADGPDHVGELRFSDLQVPPVVYQAVSNSGILIDEISIGKTLEPRRRNSHKGNHGWVLVAGSDRGMGGAVRLCGEAALRAGAGKVTIGTHPHHAATVSGACPELMVQGFDHGDFPKRLVEAVDVIVLGTGLGQSEWSKAVFECCWPAAQPLVVDADGLNLLADLDSENQAIRDPGHTVLTPHPAEAGRLLGCAAADVQADRVGAARKVADKYHAVVILKGCGSVVADGRGRYAICSLGNPGMATAGTGDALAGVVGALLGQGLESWTAAAIGVVAHALAGDFAARDIGERGMIASDLIRRLPLALNPDRTRN